MDMTVSQLASLKELIASGQEHSFYLWGAWKQKCREVKALDHNECQACKARGRYRRGELVHHVKHLRDRPDLALSIWDPATGDRQLVLLCKACHRREHPESLRQFAVVCSPVTQERWD